MSYGDLTEGEQAHWNEYTNLRQISDWPGFDAAQDQRRADARAWLQEKRKEIWRLAQDPPKGDGKGWDHANRRARYEFLKDSNLNSGAPKHEVRLPCSGSATNTEKVYIEEREVYLVFGSTTDAQKARKQASVDWLVARRKQLWHLMRDDPGGNKGNDRQTRYDNLCIATHHGSAYDAWEKGHNKWGVPYTPKTESSGGSGRSACKEWLEKHLGISENPPNSNRGNPQPDGWSNRVYGGSGVPWCANFAVCSAWDNGVSGSGTAGVANNTSLAKQGKGIYRGYTTDPSKVRAGDHAFIGSSHTGVIYDASSLTTIEGNTSPGSGGSQYNGGCVAKRQRGRSYWSGYGLVRFPDD
jgi:hypothetical protein